MAEEPNETQPNKSPRQEYIGLLTNILAEENNVHKVLMNNRSKLRGSHKKFIANEAIDIIVKRISSHHNIVVGNLNESTGDEADAPKAPKPIKVPEKLKKKGVDPEVTKALNSCVRSLNKLQDAIHNATSFYVVHTPYILRNQKIAISRALVEAVRNLKAERDHLVPPVNPDDGINEALEERIAMLSEMVDERVYLSIIQRSQEDTISEASGRDKKAGKEVAAKVREVVHNKATVESENTELDAGRFQDSAERGWVAGGELVAVPRLGSVVKTYRSIYSALQARFGLKVAEEDESKDTLEYTMRLEGPYGLSRYTMRIYLETKPNPNVHLAPDYHDPSAPMRYRKEPEDKGEILIMWTLATE